MRVKQIAEVVGQLLFGQVVYLILKIGADATDGARVGLNGFGLQALELKVLEMRLVIVLEVCIGCWCHGIVTS